MTITVQAAKAKGRNLQKAMAAWVLTGFAALLNNVAVDIAFIKTPLVWSKVYTGDKRRACWTLHRCLHD